MRRRDNKSTLLAEVPLFSACSSRELSRVASLADRITVDAGRVLTEEGAPGREFFVIEDGTATVTKGRRKIATLGRGDFFGEMALLDQGPRSATITAETPLTVYVIGSREFTRLIDEVPGVARKLLRGLAARLRSLENAPASEWNRL